MALFGTQLSRQQLDVQFLNRACSLLRRIPKRSFDVLRYGPPGRDDEEAGCVIITLLLVAHAKAFGVEAHAVGGAVLAHDEVEGRISDHAWIELSGNRVYDAQLVLLGWDLKKGARYIKRNDSTHWEFGATAEYRQRYLKKWVKWLGEQERYISGIFEEYDAKQAAFPRTEAEWRRFGQHLKATLPGLLHTLNVNRPEHERATWSKGGCGVLARVLNVYLDGRTELYAITVRNDVRKLVDHIVVRVVGMDLYLDELGTRTEREVVDGWYLKHRKRKTQLEPLVGSVLRLSRKDVSICPMSTVRLDREFAAAMKDWR